MKKTTITPVVLKASLAMMAIGVSSLAMATTSPLGGGQLTFTGSITASSCQINVNGGGSSAARLVFNESVGSSQTYAAGDVINNDVKAINIALSGCTGASLDTSKIGVTFDYTAAVVGQPYIENTGAETTGLAFEILGASNAPALTGTLIKPMSVTNIKGAQSAITGLTMLYQGEMVALGSGVQTGKTAIANVTYNISQP